VKNHQKAISTEEKFDVISQLEKGEQIVNMCRNVQLAHSSVRTIGDNAEGNKESAKSGTKVFVCVARLHRPIGMNRSKNYGCESLTFSLH
jgi:hypothetical protein